MSLRYPVKINRVNNLSDARYCAGMGVDLLGISNEITVQEYVAITGWVTGVDICLDIYKKEDNLLELVNELKPAYIETADIRDIWKLNGTEIKTILRIEVQGDYNFIYDQCVVARTYGAIVSLHNTNLSEEQLSHLQTEFKIILDVDGYPTTQIEQLCTKVAPAYIALNGGHEMAPGLKSFDEMAEVLEYLESVED